jgi:hypothetical protein
MSQEIQKDFNVAPCFYSPKDRLEELFKTGIVSPDQMPRLRFMISREMQELQVHLKRLALDSTAQFSQHTHEVNPDGTHGRIVAFPENQIEVVFTDGVKYLDAPNNGVIITGYNMYGPCYGIKQDGHIITEGALKAIEVLSRNAVPYQEFMREYAQSLPHLAPYLSEHAIVTDTFLDSETGILSERRPGYTVVENNRGQLFQIKPDPQLRANSSAIVGFNPNSNATGDCHHYTNDYLEHE